MGINNRGLLEGRVQDFYKAKQNCYDFVLIVCLRYNHTSTGKIIMINLGRR